jgi:hypothetical protein
MNLGVHKFGHPIDNFTFQVENSQVLFSHSMQSKCAVDSKCTHHMDKDASLFTSLDKTMERKIYVVDECSLNMFGRGDVPCRHGKIVNVYHVSNLSVNLLLFSQLT